MACYDHMLDMPGCPECERNDPWRLRGELKSLVDAGMRLVGQVYTFAIQFHQRERHPEPFSECGNGTCRSSLKDALAWEQAAGDQGHNWIAEQGRKG